MRRLIKIAVTRQLWIPVNAYHIYGGGVVNIFMLRMSGGDMFFLTVKDL